MITPAIEYRIGKEIPEPELRAIYEDDGWIGYTRDMSRLLCGLANSLYVVSAWNGERLIGLLRAVGDGQTIVYIQDLIVMTSHRRLGIGTELVQRLLAQYCDVRQKVLLADEAPYRRAFYEKLGFRSCDRGDMAAFVRFDPSPLPPSLA